MRITVDVAFDTLTNRHVRAGSLSSARFPDRFICPLCRTEVVYASGPSVRTHFRHRIGTDREACELYSGLFIRNVALARHESEQLNAVLVAKFGSPPDDGSVSFAVRFRAENVIESVIFVSGGEETPYTIHHCLPQQNFLVRSLSETYIVKVREKAGMVQPHIVEGLGNAPVLFREAEREAVRLNSHRVLKPGNQDLTKYGYRFASLYVSFSG